MRFPFVGRESSELRFNELDRAEVKSYNSFKLIPFSILLQPEHIIIGQGTKQRNSALSEALFRRVIRLAVLKTIGGCDAGNRIRSQLSS